MSRTKGFRFGLCFIFLIFFCVSSLQADISPNDSQVISLFSDTATDSLKVFTTKQLSGQDFQALQAAKRFRMVSINQDAVKKGILSQGDKLYLRLFKDFDLFAAIDKTALDINGVYSVRARIEDSEFGYVILSIYEDLVLGFISFPEYNQEFQLSYLKGSSSHVIQEIDPILKDVLDEGPPLITADIVNFQETISDLENEISELEGQTNTIIDVMIVYTPQAKTWADTNATSINNIISLAIEKAQLVLDNSGVDINLRLKHSAEVNYTESGKTSTDLERLRNTSDDHLDVIHEWRDIYGADLVSLFTKCEDFGGLGYFLNSTSGNPNTAFNITRVQQAHTSYTMIHEMGHNMGAHHHKQQNFQPGPGLYSYSAGWRWTGSDKGKYCSVMTYEAGNYFSDGITHYCIPYFSNPNINYSNVATGHAADGDNARTLMNIKGVVANYRTTSLAAELTQLSAVSGARTGHTITLWAEIRNTGTVALPSDARVYFLVRGPGFDKWVGFTSVAGLGVGGLQQYGFNWTIPVTAKPGTYNYWALVYKGNTPISAWSTSQSFTISVDTTVSAKVTRLWPVSDTQAGKVITLWAAVRNTGTVALPSDARVYFLVRGPGFNKWVGFTSVAGLGVGGLQWYGFKWTIPVISKPGTYNYWAIVYKGNTPISAWSTSESFNIAGLSGVSAKVMRLWPVSDAQTGKTTTLWAEVRNTGTVALPSDARVYFLVRGPGFDKWVGSGLAAGLPAGNLRWYHINWAIPASSTPGTYNYWAIVYRGNTPISGWSTNQSFTVGGSMTGFSEQFKGGTAGNWIRDSGSWSVVSNEYYYTAGVPNRISISTYNAVYNNIDYSVRIGRNSSVDEYSSGIIYRAGGNLTSEGILTNGYLFLITRNGYFRWLKIVSGDVVHATDWYFSYTINQKSAWNILRVVANGNSMYCYINGTMVLSVTDNDSLSSGRAGVLMYRDSASTGNGFWVDWATLTLPSSGSPAITDRTIPEQASLNATNEILEISSISDFLTWDVYTP